MEQEPLLDVETPPAWFHPGQEALWNATETTLVALCGTQGGKTAVLPWWLLRETQRCASFIKADPLRRNAILAGPTMTLLQAQAIPAFKDVWIDQLKLGKWVDSPKPRLIVSKEGAQRLVGAPVQITIHCAYASDPNNLESMTAYAAVWDEGGQSDNKEISYEAIRRRLLSAAKHGVGRLLIATTPYDWNWLKHRIVDREAIDEKIRVVNWPSWSNPEVDEVDCRRELETGMPRWRWNMMYLGRYERPAGQIYDCFDRGVNTCPRFTVPDSWSIYVGVDFGPENTAAVILAQERNLSTGGKWLEPTGKYYLIDSYHAGGKQTTPDHILAIRAKGNNACVSAAKPPIGYGGSSTEQGWREAWTRAGMPLSEPMQTDVELQIQTVWSAFKQGRLVIFDDLAEVLREVDTYSREIDAEGNRTERIAQKATFHRLDALRYIAPTIFGLPLSRRAIEVFKRR